MSAAGTAAQVAAGSVTVELNDTEFVAYVCALRNHCQAARTAQIDDWKARMRAIDALHDIQQSLHGDNIDTAYLRACWESRKIAAETWDETYSLVLAGPTGEAAVLALAEYAGPDDKYRRELHTAAAGVLTRIAEAVPDVPERSTDEDKDEG